MISIKISLRRGEYDGLFRNLFGRLDIMRLLVNINKVYLVLILNWGFLVGNGFMQVFDEKMSKGQGWYGVFLWLKGSQYGGEFFQYGLEFVLFEIVISFQR